ncbi:hypothetical protein BKA61DRAFT_681323 [Leptodontidium sp. MPI-SDFR-AT-0119]|nr:hypothetical protein BKA61DRAFT_681323 [Leptodontidium sp. MPI-SDFR-AT-0119]
MGSSTPHSMVLLTSLILLLTYFNAIVLGAPAPPTEVVGVGAEAISNITDTDFLLNSRNDLNTQSSLTTVVVQGNPDNGETWNPEPRVSWFACKPSKDHFDMCTAAYASKSEKSGPNLRYDLVIYDHNCIRLGAWTNQDIAGLATGEGTNDVHGWDFKAVNLPYNLIVYQPSWFVPSNVNHYAPWDMFLKYGAYFSRPFYWRDWGNEWYASERKKSVTWGSGTTYDFWRVVFNCKN